MIEDNPRPPRPWPWLPFHALQEAAHQGETTAAARLAYAYAYGQGTAPDFIKAYAWAMVSIFRGGEQTAELLHSLERDMPPHDIRLARELAERIQAGRASNPR